MAELGHVTLILTLMVAAYACVASLLGSMRGMASLVDSAVYGLYTTPLLLVVATISLIYAFVTRDFSVRYVAENSDLAMPKMYTWVAFYAGNAGSMLYITFILALLVVGVLYYLRKNLREISGYTATILSLMLGFFVFVLVFYANPFDKLPVTPPDGQGINPLLVHLGMFFHPPMQMAGLISVVAPFSIVMGTVMAGKSGSDIWVEHGRTWGLVSWLVLTIGLMLGSWWAYTILGWGGYWAWDPVENSALMPWLVMTAFVHTVVIQRQRGMFRTWNLVLAIMAFSLAQVGMFLNRGGPVPSVHSFAESAMGWTFLVFMAITLFGSVVILVLKSSKQDNAGKLESLLSREAAFLFNNLLLLAIAFITLWGTIFPLIADLLNNETVSVGPPFYNRMNGPLILCLLVLMAIAPMLPWRQARFSQIWSMLRAPVALALAVSCVLVIAGVRLPLAVVSFGIISLVIGSVLQEWVRGVIVRHQRGESFGKAFVRLVLSNRSRYGGYIVHIGIMLLAIGATGSSFYATQEDFSLAPGESVSMGNYTMRYVSLDSEEYGNRLEEEALFDVTRGGHHIGDMKPVRAFYPGHNVGATKAAIWSTPLEDFYIVPSRFDEDGRGVFRVHIFPLVWWMWASGPVLVLGILVAISPRRSAHDRSEESQAV
ncbi:MAG: cytochrome C biogenesis protein [Chloroflexi bacterium]|nr:cytochrome C biogenesis protein [Chloroflexota bacterium]